MSGDGEPREVEESVEGDVLAAVRCGAGSMSVEPGGQIELSLPPMTQPTAVQAALADYAAAIERELAATPFRALYLGHQPLTMPEDIPLRAKPRYRIMDRKLRAAGTLGVHMMRATAGMQVTLDFDGGAECAHMLKAALVMAPVVSAFYANSRSVGGRDSGYESFRERVWWNTDASRCGVPCVLLRERPSMADYVEFALDAEAMFLERDGTMREVEGRTTFRQLWQAGEELTLADFVTHTSTLFPAARIRGGVEVRSADCVPPELVGSFVALHAACLYDAEARHAACELHPYRGQTELGVLHETAARHGLEASLPDGFSICSAACELIDTATAGLERLIACGLYQAESQRLLDPLRESLEKRCRLAATTQGD